MAASDFDTVVLQGTTYLIPKSDGNPPYGEELNDYLKALGEAFATVVGPGDIQNTTATIVNNQSSTLNVSGLSFDSGTVRGAIVDYVIYRTTSLSTKKEVGMISLIYDSTASVGDKWQFSKESVDDSGVVLTVTDGGQLQYTSSNMSGSSYVGKMTFRARALVSS